MVSLASCNADGNVAVKFDTKELPDTVYLSYTPMSDIINNVRPDQVRVINDTIPVKGASFDVKLKADSAACYNLIMNDGQMVTFYTQPGEHINIDVTELKPRVKATVTGSILMDDMAELAKTVDPIEEEYARLMENENITMEQRMAIVNKYAEAMADFVRKHPGSPAAPFALLNLDGKEYVELMETLTPDAKKSMFYPMVEKKAERARAALEIEQKQAQLQNGSTMAPNFTLKNLEGKDVSLSDFRGKYVVIDFWGSWCGWCVRGFPALKEAYAKYKGKLEVIGVDCQDSDADWREAVKKFDLPWVHVYNPKDSKVLAEYYVEGFPTKVIVNPEGKIVNITVGENPDFYKELAKYMGN